MEFMYASEDVFDKFVSITIYTKHQTCGDRSNSNLYEDHFKNQ